MAKDESKDQAVVRIFTKISLGSEKKIPTEKKKPVYISVIIGPPSKTRPALSVRGRPGRFVKKSAIGQLFENPSYDPQGSYQSTVASQLYWLLVSSEDVANAIGAVEMKMIHYSCFDFVKSIEYQLIVTLDLDESQSNQVLVSLVYSKKCIT